MDTNPFITTLISMISALILLLVAVLKITPANAAAASRNPRMARIKVTVDKVVLFGRPFIWRSFSFIVLLLLAYNLYHIHASNPVITIGVVYAVGFLFGLLLLNAWLYVVYEMALRVNAWLTLTESTLRKSIDALAEEVRPTIGKHSTEIAALDKSVKAIEKRLPPDFLAILSGPSKT